MSDVSVCENFQITTLPSHCIFSIPQVVRPRMCKFGQTISDKFPNYIRRGISVSRYCVGRFCDTAHLCGDVVDLMDVIVAAARRVIVGR